MKLFAVRGAGYYSAGLIVVAARNEKSAIKAAQQNGDPSWNIHYDEVEDLDAEIEGKERVLTVFEFGE